MHWSRGLVHLLFEVDRRRAVDLATLSRELLGNLAERYVTGLDFCNCWS